VLNAQMTSLIPSTRKPVAVMNAKLITLCDELGFEAHNARMMEQAELIFSDKDPMTFDELVKRFKSQEEWEKSRNPENERPAFLARSRSMPETGEASDSTLLNQISLLVNRASNRPRRPRQRCHFCNRSHPGGEEDCFVKHPEKAPPGWEHRELKDAPGNARSASKRKPEDSPLGQGPAKRKGIPAINQDLD